MTKAAVPVRGGPWDGAEVRPGLTFAWIGRRARQSGCVGYPEPGRGRALYRYAGRSYVFIGHDTVLCEGCNVYRSQPIRVPGAPDPCPLCGHEPEWEEET